MTIQTFIQNNPWLTLALICYLFVTLTTIVNWSIRQIYNRLFCKKDKSHLNALQEKRFSDFDKSQEEMLKRVRSITPNPSPVEEYVQIKKTPQKALKRKKEVYLDLT